MVLQTGLEPVLYGLSFRFLYRDWDTGAYGAVNGDRTRDLRLGKPMFCRLNYYCMGFYIVYVGAAYGIRTHTFSLED